MDSFEFRQKEISTQESYFKRGDGNLGARARRTKCAVVPSFYVVQDLAIRGSGDLSSDFVGKYFRFLHEQKL